MSQEMAVISYKLLEDDEAVSDLLRRMSDNRIKTFRQHLVELERKTSAIMRERGLSKVERLEFSEDARVQRPRLGVHRAWARKQRGA